MIINIYDKNTLELIAKPVATNIEEFKAEPNLFYPDFDLENHIISDVEYQNPILDNGKIREQTKEELYKAGKYILSENELFENGKIKTVELCDCEYIKNNQVKLDREKKIEILRKELYDLRIEKEKQPFEFEVNGTKYLQYNRTIDQSNITKILFSLILNFLFNLLKKVATGTKIELTQVLAQLSDVKYPSWKFYTFENGEKYEAVSVMQFIEMSKKMQKLTTVSMQSETVLSHALLDKSDKELKEFNAKEEYEKFWTEAMKEE